MQTQSVETVTPTVAAAESAAVLETNFGNEQPVVTVPYSSLQRSPLNVRTKPPSGIAGLAANYEKEAVMRRLPQDALSDGCHRPCHFALRQDQSASSQASKSGFFAISVDCQGESNDPPAQGQAASFRCWLERSDSSCRA
ncbi:hypothetical protein [Burkholderia sp. BCC1988]|uniref:hypothetical protein n=1 Tax=Burkholderia sp. BCC1988 TaxID=2817443 RepID=UPI002AAFEB35|nr:hypothetical protein [Burkholderia sp. BCC1988]